MKYNVNAGIIYDTIYYCMIYFNKQRIENQFTTKKYNIEDAFTYFDEVKNGCRKLPECIMPFAYYDFNHSSFLYVYFMSHTNFHRDTVKNFIELVKNKKSLKKEVFDYLFNDLPDEVKRKLVEENNAQVVDKVIKNKDWPLDVKVETIKMINYFDFTADCLIDSLVEVSRQIRDLHQKYQDKIFLQINDSESKENLILYEKMYSMDESKANRQFFSLSFMNPFSAISKYDGFKEAVYLFGERHKEVIESECNNSKVSLEKALNILGDPSKFRIVKCLNRHGKLTGSEISRMINIATSTAFRFLSVLVEERVIKEDHQYGRRIYYSVNNEYILAFEKLIIQFTDEFRNQI